MKTVTLDIIKIGESYRELITFNYNAQIERPMLSIVRALENLKEQYTSVNGKDNLYSIFQIDLLKELLGTEYEAVSSLLEFTGNSINDFTEAEAPLKTENISEFIQFEINTIEEFLIYLFPGVPGEAKSIEENYEIILTESNEIQIIPSKEISIMQGRTPSEKYTEIMGKYGSYLFSPELCDEMINTVYKNGIPREALLQDRSFVPNLKSKRYSQLSDDIRKVEHDNSKVTVTSDEGKRIYVRGNKIKSRCYYSSAGILPLVWAEIKFAIENDIFIRRCPSCDNYFALAKNAMKKLYCNDKCRDKYRVQKDKQNPNYEQIQRLKMRKSRTDDIKKKEEIQKEIDILKNQS